VTVIGIDLCTSEGSVSIVKEGEPLGVSMWNQSREHAERVFVEVERLLEKSGVRKNDVNLVVVTSGPGSFTGVRLSVTAGKSLKVLGLDVKAVSTLQLVGFGILKTGLPVVSLFPGRRNRYYTLIREKVEDSAEVLDLTEEELFSLLKERSDYKVVYKGTVPETIKNEFKALYETTPLSLIAAFLPFEAPQLLKSLHFYYVRDHDAKPSCKRL
jgi:tRNA threonylcarbamoyladenosine biosynthesis protein TsaB